MRRYNPRTHVFDYGGIVPQPRRERDTLKEFCKRMRRCHRASYRVLPIRTAIDRNLVVRVGGATVDGVLRTSLGSVAVELLGYSPLDDRGDVMVRDVDLRREIKRALYDRLEAKRYSFTLWYREKARGEEGPGVVRTVPPERERRALIRELRAVVSESPPLAPNQFLSILFIPTNQMTPKETRQGILMDVARFPICATYLAQVRLQGLPPSLSPEVDSELLVGAIGLDEGWVRVHLAKKAGISLHQGRRRAKELPVWLIIHSEHASHRMIRETNRPRAIALCREVLGNTPHDFQRAYWADGTSLLDATWVGRVM